ncbi:MAG: hypothetical protein SF339_07115 [Blastocatellia bacterium]|nr:hypothetical protein [Blastocatellia bacterium]
MRPLRMWALAAIIAMGGLTALTSGTSAQERARTPRTRTQASVASDRGYVDGYEDGFREGKSDYGRETERDHRRSKLWQDADRGYQTGFGSLADYREGYRLGFELGYTDGFYGRTYTRKTPPNALTARPRLRAQSPNRAATVLPEGLSLRLRLLTPLSTKTNQEGDQFMTRVLAPTEYAGATVAGHIARIERSGRLTGHTEMILEFDTVTLPNGRSGMMAAQIERVYVGDSIKTIDNEGNVESASKTKDIIIRSGGGAALGAIIGGIAKGGKGAAIGAIIGAGVGAGSVYIQGKKDLILDLGTEMSVRTTAPQYERPRD